MQPLLSLVNPYDPSGFYRYPFARHEQYLSISRNDYVWQLFLIISTFNNDSNSKLNNNKQTNIDINNYIITRSQCVKNNLWFSSLAVYNSQIFATCEYLLMTVRQTKIVVFPLTRSTLFSANFFKNKA